MRNVEATFFRTIISLKRNVENDYAIAIMLFILHDINTLMFRPEKVILVMEEERS